MILRRPSLISSFDPSPGGLSDGGEKIIRLSVSSLALRLGCNNHHKGKALSRVMASGPVKTYLRVMPRAGK